MNVRSYLLGLVTILVLAISYYFIIALPAHNRAMLQFEREKYDTTQKEKEMNQAAEIKEKEENEIVLDNCIKSAEARYYDYIRLNGTEVHGKKGLYNAPLHILESASKTKKADLEECYRKYRR